MEKTTHFPARLVGRIFDRDWEVTKFVDWILYPRPERVVDFAFLLIYTRKQNNENVLKWGKMVLNFYPVKRIRVDKEEK